jgi:putative ABC transport system permease protein
VRRNLGIAREAVASAWSQPIASILSIVIVAGMCAAVLLTTGRTVGAEESVLGSFDSAGTRSIVVRADADAGLDTSVLGRLAHIEGIDWVGAFGAADDATNAAIPGGTRVPLRLGWGDDFERLGIPNVRAVPDRSAWASAAALSALGAPAGVGGIVSEDGDGFAIAGEIPVPDYLNFLEPMVIAPQNSGSQTEVVTVLVVIADRPDLVAPVSESVRSLLSVEDPKKATMTTSESLASLRAMVQGQLGAYGRSLVIAIFALTAALVAAILYSLVMMRRKDFGRRRALGATRGLIVRLLLTQMAALSAVGVIVGCGASAITLQLTGDPLPSFQFFVAIAVLAIAVGVVAALLPAVAASRRDPLRELRVP